MASLFGKSCQLPNFGKSGGDLPQARKVDQPDNKFKNTVKQNFPRGQRKSLGVAQLMLGIFFVSFGVPLFQSRMSIAATIAIPWWGGGLFMVSGAISIYAERKLNSITLRCSAVFNLLSAATSFCTFVLLTVDLRTWVPRIHQSYTGKPQLLEAHFSMRVILILFALLELSISITVAVIGWNKVWDCHKNTEELPENSRDRSNTYETLNVKDTTYTSMRAIKSSEVSAV
ncbi:membrane-spanning 4-domains subfamily A member 15-like [Amblyraja radiata]|uniref:membrane-spanning 4-domains subfamily A member 15-like n=1 Tax=Amblyraja radiata TaxID=386614 RepID=UPI0014029415|nr:membrane-spanning 4-domains subfamily A member 15-like [Amblyraja radiata]